MIGLIVFGSIAAAVGYIALILYFGGKLQDWATARGYPPVLLPWAFSMLMLALPASIAAQVLA